MGARSILIETGTPGPGSTNGGGGVSPQSPDDLAAAFVDPSFHTPRLPE